MGAATGRVRRSSASRRVELTDAALHIIATRGIAALTTRSLTDHVGLSSGAIFRHFPSLDALLDAVVERVEGVLEATFPEEGLSPLDRLERFVAARSSAVGDQLGILRLVRSEQFMLALSGGASARLRACMKKTRRFVVDCLREGQLAGEVRADVDAEALATIVIGTIQVLAFSATTPGPRPASAASVRLALTTLLRGPARAPGRARETRRSR